MNIFVHDLCVRIVLLRQTFIQILDGGVVNDSLLASRFPVRISDSVGMDNALGEIRLR